MKISTFIACKNHGKYLAQAIESILGQTRAPSQIILIDDGSRDHSYHVMEAFSSVAEVRCHPICRGNIASYNEGILLSTGDVIHLMAADDYLLSTEVYARCMELLERDPLVGFCTIGLVHVDEGGHSVWHHSVPPFIGIAEPRSVLEELLIRGNFINGGGTLVRKEAQREAGMYDSDLPYSADFANWIRILSKGWKGAFIPEPLYAYRQHSGAMTHSSSAPTKERDQCMKELREALSGV